jgi:hypothetical protein
MIALTIKFSANRDHVEEEEVKVPEVKHAPAKVITLQPPAKKDTPALFQPLPSDGIKFKVGGTVVLAKSQLWKNRVGRIVSIDPTNRFPLEIILEAVGHYAHEVRTRCTFNEVDPVPVQQSLIH